MGLANVRPTAGRYARPRERGPPFLIFRDLAGAACQLARAVLRPGVRLHDHAVDEPTCPRPEPDRLSPDNAGLWQRLVDVRRLCVADERGSPARTRRPPAPA